MNATIGRIRLYAKQLRLPTVAHPEQLLREARANQWSYEEFLAQLLHTEAEQRKENQRRRRIKAAKFPLLRTLDTFDFDNLDHVKPETIWSLADNSYIRRHENIICMGNPGMGKTHLSIALGLIACNDGFRVRFYSAPVLANELVEAQENHSLGRLQRQLSKLDLLILDDLSYLSFSREQSELLFQVISERAERASLIISTNLEFSKWVQFFKDPMLTAALVDRVTHRAHILNMNGESYRLKESRARNANVKVDQT
ncbi:MAG TPA: IS21-like element helper ATPase IstB [Limnochordia bacterium]|jgi:DNA replication protein DnaC|nr:IS21-like element helper ATPase IstB [Bacillota bacterium]HOK32780.1 IS21-like element helper ATPase IstB [Limnochordia bacterium]